MKIWSGYETRVKLSMKYAMATNSTKRMGNHCYRAKTSACRSPKARASPLITIHVGTPELLYPPPGLLQTKFSYVNSVSVRLSTWIPDPIISKHIQKCPIHWRTFIKKFQIEFYNILTYSGIFFLSTIKFECQIFMDYEVKIKICFVHS